MTEADHGELDEGALEAARTEAYLQWSVGAEHGDLAEAAIRAYLDHLPPAATGAPEGWKGMESAPRDGTLILIWTDDGACALPPFLSLCAWHPDGGFCVDELRSPTHWRPLPSPPKEPQA